jgi:hypothetical protein
VTVRMPEHVLNKLLAAALRRRGYFVSVRSEVWIGDRMRADIVAEQPNGDLALFELKARPLQQKDVEQIDRYVGCLEAQGHTVHAHLVGDSWPVLVRPEHIVFMGWDNFWREMAA